MYCGVWLSGGSVHHGLVVDRDGIRFSQIQSSVSDESFEYYCCHACFTMNRERVIARISDMVGGTGGRKGAPRCQVCRRKITAYGRHITCSKKCAERYSVRFGGYGCGGRNST